MTARRLSWQKAVLSCVRLPACAGVCYNDFVLENYAARGANHAKSHGTQKNLRRLIAPRDAGADVAEHALPIYVHQPLFQRTGHAPGIWRRNVYERAHGRGFCAHLSGRPAQVSDAAHARALWRPDGNYADMYPCAHRALSGAVDGGPGVADLCGGSLHRPAQRRRPPPHRPPHASHHRHAGLLAADRRDSSAAAGGHGMDSLGQRRLARLLATLGRLCRGRGAGGLQPVARARPAGPGGPAGRRRRADRGPHGRGAAGGQRLRRLPAHAYAGAHGAAAHAGDGLYLHRAERAGIDDVHAAFGRLRGGHARGVAAVPAAGASAL